MSGASEKAIEAAERANRDVMHTAFGPASCSHCEEAAKASLIAAHSPALGLDRSVCSRDVVEALRGRAERGVDGAHWYFMAADFIEREFSSGAAARPAERDD